MELRRIEILLEKYFEGNTSITEEKEIKAYFSSDLVVPELGTIKTNVCKLSKSKRNTVY
ncbi:MAG: hypothetical protein R2790_09275 [Flavobacterium haoranii]